MLATSPQLARPCFPWSQLVLVSSFMQEQPLRPDRDKYYAQARRSPSIRRLVDIEDACKKLGFSRGASFFARSVIDHAFAYAKQPSIRSEEKRASEALHNIHIFSVKALALLKRKTFRRQEYQRAFEAFNSERKTLEQNPFIGLLLLVRCGITDETVRWVTFRPPPRCQRCLDSSRPLACSCLTWPTGSPFDLDFAPPLHWQLIHPKAEELDPLHYHDLAQQIGLLRLYEARLSPGSSVFTQPRGRPGDDSENDLMFGICESFKEAFGKIADRRNAKAMALFTTILEIFNWTYINLDYRIKRYEDVSRRSRRELDRILADPEKFIAEALEKSRSFDY
jgi:hypothetical protein